MKLSILMILMLFTFSGCSTFGPENAQGSKSCCEKNYDKKTSCQGGSCSLKTSSCTGGSCKVKSDCGSCKGDKKDCSDCKSSKNCVSSSCPLKSKNRTQKSCCAS